ncbi:MAG: hypothetical protein II577_01800 [Erysipelotrichaceae bacterium]|nr:hypothetical protein [Erysipelotrichaceae bacterium]
MIREELKNSEPIAYRLLENALRNGRVAHSYLFSGEYSPLKIEAAYLLAMSIIEGKGDFACEECDTCKRIRKGTYFDVIYIDGYRESIKKDMVDRILDEFSRTSLESAGKKVYILANINNASLKVLNMILKFMEEPGNSDTYGILISDRKEDLLPTIVSRCEDVPFLTRDFSHLIKDYEEKGFDYIDAYLLADIYHSFESELDLNDPHYFTAKEYVYQTLENLDNKEFLPVLFYRDFYPSFKDRDDFKTCTDRYLSIMIRMIEDAIAEKKTPDEDYDSHLEMIRNHKPEKLLEIFENASDATLRNAERRLLFDGIAYEILTYI